MTTNAPSSDNIYLGKGELFFDRFNETTGAEQGYYHLGNCSKFGITLNDDILTMPSHMDAAAAEYKRVSRKREVVIEITAHELAAFNLALAMMGDESTFTSTAGTTTETMTTSVAKGRYYKLARRGVTAITSIVQGGTDTWSATTDYTLQDGPAGIVHVAATTSNKVTTATTAIIIYVATTVSQSLILGATRSRIEGKLLFVPDPAAGPQWDVEVFHAALSPSGQTNFIGEDFAEYTLSLAALDDTVGTHGGSTSYPYYRLINRGQA